MQRARYLIHTAFFLAVVGFVLPPIGVTTARGNPPSRANVFEIALGKQNELRGQLANREGQPVEAAVVVLIRDGKAQVSTVSDQYGRFSFRLRQGGTYQLVSGDTVVGLRAWTHNAAPPNCQSEVLMVYGQVARGQQGGLPPAGLLNPWFVAGVVAAAVAVPVLMHQNRVDRGKGS